MLLPPAPPSEGVPPGDIQNRLTGVRGEVSKGWGGQEEQVAIALGRYGDCRLWGFLARTRWGPEEQLPGVQEGEVGCIEGIGRGGDTWVSVSLCDTGVLLAGSSGCRGRGGSLQAEVDQGARLQEEAWRQQARARLKTSSLGMSGILTLLAKPDPAISVIRVGSAATEAEQAPVSQGGTVGGGGHRLTGDRWSAIRWNHRSTQIWRRSSRCAAKEERLQTLHVGCL